MVYGSYSIHGNNALAVAYGSYAGGRIALPVAPSQYIYSHFEHVSGVPAPEGTSGVSINRLKVLDVLIDQLAQMKKKPDIARDSGGQMSEERIDALIDQYEQQIRGARATAARMPYAPSPSAPSGAVFNLVA